MPRHAFFLPYKRHRAKLTSRGACEARIAARIAARVQAAAAQETAEAVATAAKEAAETAARVQAAADQATALAEAEAAAAFCRSWWQGQIIRSAREEVTRRRTARGESSSDID